MPEWLHNRAEHILAKNPSMPKSEAFAIATQQSHATGHSPKGYGTAKGRRIAKAKFSTPKADEKRSNPGGLESPKLKHAAAAVLQYMEATGLLEKFGFAASAYGGQPAQNAPGMRGRSQIPPFVAPPIEVKEANIQPLRRIGELVTGNKANKLYEAGRRHAELARDGSAAHAKASRKLRSLAYKEEGNVGRAQGALATGAGIGVAADLTGLAERHGKAKEAGMGVGAGMSTSQYSGPLSYGPFKQESGIPAFVSPNMTKTDPRLEAPAYAVGGDKTAEAGTGAMSAVGKLRSAQRLTAPKTTGFAGPSIADVAKPRGYGKPLPGALKGTI